ncbi:MAG: hypothetical protein ACI9IJ_001644 [Psychromonas sp.]|jgi:hypothetical protein
MPLISIITLGHHIMPLISVITLGDQSLLLH